MKTPCNLDFLASSRVVSVTTQVSVHIQYNCIFFNLYILIYDVFDVFDFWYKLDSIHKSGGTARVPCRFVQGRDMTLVNATNHPIGVGLIYVMFGSCINLQHVFLGPHFVKREIPGRAQR